MENDDERTVIEQLWADYKSSGAREARDRLIIHYSPLVKYVAGRVSVGLPQNIEQADLQQIFNQISFVGLVALDEMLAGSSGDRGESTTLGDTIADKSDGPVAAFEVEEMKQILASAVNRLGDREKVVLTLYYYEGLTLAEIGKVLGVTESRVCQIHTKAVFQLRSRMSEPERESV